MHSHFSNLEEPITNGAVDRMEDDDCVLLLIAHVLLEGLSHDVSDLGRPVLSGHGRLMHRSELSLLVLIIELQDGLYLDASLHLVHLPPSVLRSDQPGSHRLWIGYYRELHHPADSEIVFGIFTSSCRHRMLH